MTRKDDVGELIRSAGKRPAVPPERMARVRAAAREEWMQTARPRRTGRRLVWAAAAAVVLIGLFGAYVRFFSTSELGATTVTSVSGPAWVRADGEARLLQDGDSIGFGDEISTGDNGRISLTLSSGHSMRVDVDTRVRVSGADELALTGGRVYLDSGASGQGTEQPITVMTEYGSVTEVGTQFEVDLSGDGLRVRVREGAVVVTGGHQVDAGRELVLGNEGVSADGPIAVHGLEWEWLVPVTPLPELEGLALVDFLSWISRERGVRLAYADADVALAATETVLGGSADALTLDNALDAVLPTCRMTHRIEEDRLVVSFLVE